MADLNALIAQGAQFNMPDQLGQYAKMQQLQAGQQQMRTGALQEQTAGMQLQQLKEDRANMAKLSQQLSAKGIGPRQYFEALQSSGDSKYQQLGIEGLIKLDQTEKYDAFLKSQQPTPAQQAPAPMAGGLGADRGAFLPGVPAPTNALASQAAAPVPSVNALASKTASSITALENKIAVLRSFKDDRAQAEATRLQKQVDEYRQGRVIGPGSSFIMNGETVFTAPEKTTPVKNIANVNPGDFTPASVAKFNTSGNYADLIPKPTKVAGDGTGVAKAPSGYRVTATGDLEAIPGGPAAGKPMTDLQKQAYKKDFANDTANIKSAIDTANELETLTDSLVGNPDKKIKPHPGLGGITGYAGMLPSLPTGEAAKAEQKLETFKGKVKALGRTIASQQGKLGNMAVQEWQMVSDSVQAIKPTAGNLDEQMRDVVRQAKQLSKNMQDKFDLTYEGEAPAARKPAGATGGWGKAVAE